MDITIPIESEDDFINACVRNERWAQKKLYEDNYASMMSLSMRYANNKQWGLKNCSHARKLRFSKSGGEDIEKAYAISTADVDAVSRCGESEILKSIQQLTFAYRSVFNLYVVEGFSHKEISEQLGITESTSRSNLVKARIKLKEILLGKGKIHGE